MEAGPSEESLREVAIREKVISAVEQLYVAHEDKMIHVRKKNDGSIKLSVEIGILAPEDVEAGADVAVKVAFTDQTKYAFSVETHIDNPAQGQLPIEE